MKPPPPESFRLPAATGAEPREKKKRAPRKKPAAGGAKKGGRSPRRAPAAPRTLFTRANGLLALAAAMAGLGLLYLYPFSTDFTRRATLGLCLAGLALGLALLWRVIIVRWGLLAVLAAAGSFLALPGRTNYDRLALRAEFATALRRYHGVRYCVGGEGRYGIDGPGLVRRAAVEAPFLYGVRTVNPWLIRHAFRVWWSRDNALGQWPGSRRISKVKAVHGFNDLILYPGDYALLDRGTGAPPGGMAYLGHHEWIVADGERATVAVVDGRRAEASPDLQKSGALYRWRLLEARR